MSKWVHDLVAPYSAWGFPVIFITLAIVGGWATYHGLRTGVATLSRGGGTYYRDKNPAMFWLAIAFDVLFSAAVLFMGGVMAMDNYVTSHNRCANFKNNETLQYYAAFVRECEATLRIPILYGTDRELADNNMGFALFRLNKARQAIGYFDKVLAISPDDEWAYSERGSAYDLINEPKAALGDFNEALKLKPTDGNTLRERAVELLRMGHQDLAIKDLQKAESIAPNNDDTYRILAWLYTQRGDCVAGLAMANKAISLNSKAALSYIYKGQCEIQDGKYQAAIGDLDRALAIAPTDSDALGSRADANFELGRSVQAFKDVNTALKTTSNYPGVLNKRCWFEVMLDTNIAGAVSDCTSAIRGSPKEEAYYETRALAYYRAQRYSDAINDCDFVLKHHPNAIAPLYIRGLARRHLGEASYGDDLSRARDIYPAGVQMYSDSGFK